MFKNLATIVEVFGDRVLSLVGLRPMCNHRTMVAAGRGWSQTYFGPQDRTLVADKHHDHRTMVGKRSATFKGMS